MSAIQHAHIRSVDEIIAGRLFLPVFPDTCELLGISKSSAYEAIRRGQLEVLHIGRRIVVPVGPLLRLAGVSE